MSLTDLAIRNAKPREKAYKLGDGRGLYLLRSQCRADPEGAPKPCPLDMSCGARPP